MIYLLGFAGMLAALYLFFEFITRGGIFLFLGYASLMLIIICGFGSLDIFLNRRKK